MAEIKSVPDFKCISPKQISMMILVRILDLEHLFIFRFPRLNNLSHCLLYFVRLGVISDKEICEKIILDIEESKYKK